MDLKWVPVSAKYIFVVVDCHMIPCIGATKKSYVHISWIDRVMSLAKNIQET